MPHYKRYLDEMPGVSLQDIWDDINPAMGRENLGYPTQKPTELLRRIVLLGSNPGEVVLDPFCGCGTAIDAVETVNRERRGKKRRWIGIDITHLSVGLIKHRLTRFNPPPEYQVLGEPANLSAAQTLAREDPYQFQFWALGLIGARPVGHTKKKGADKGVDGIRYFMDGKDQGAWQIKRMLVQVKGGHTGSSDIRDLAGTLGREQAELGVFLTLEEPTQRMRTEAAEAGMYLSPWNGQNYPKMQILTIAELLADPHRPNPGCLRVPGGVVGQHTLPEAPRHTGREHRQKPLDFEPPE